MARVAGRTLLLSVCLGMIAGGGLSAPAGDEVVFVSARPVWPAGRETEMNRTAGFRAVFSAEPGDPVRLRVAAATIYRAWVNGQYVAHGPARGPLGYFRVDEWDISKALVPGANLVALEVAGYNADSHYQMDQPSFLEAEVVSGRTTLASTAGDGVRFQGAILGERVQKTCRYSPQRLFTEVYRLAPGYDRWRREPGAPMETDELSVAPSKALLPRRVPYPGLEPRDPVVRRSRGRLEPAVSASPIWQGRAATDVGLGLKGFGPDELEANPVVDVQRFLSVPEDTLERPWAEEPRVDLEHPSYEILDFGKNLTGFLGARVTCTSPTTLWFIFDEVLERGRDVSVKRQECVRLVSYGLAPGEYRVETIEPYTLRYLKLASPIGGCSVDEVYLREYAHPEPEGAFFAAGDARLNDLFSAGVLTNRENALDLLTDCPSRERSGWLCDAFFTARATCDLTGNTDVENNFFENFLLPREFPDIPPGMLPMCYPADQRDGRFIPAWALWFVIQLDEFARRGGDRSTVEGLRPKVMGLFDYFKPFENRDGLLEDLEGWQFVTYSMDRLRGDVNYPTNMLYAAALSAAARLYGAPGLEAKANKIRIRVRDQSFDGVLFADNGLRRRRTLEVTRDRTEACQYFAFFCDVANRAGDPDLWRLLVDWCGPGGDPRSPFDPRSAAHLFVGKMLRIEMLSRSGLARRIIDEALAFWYPMAEETGTLWEFSSPTGSCCHGYASHIVHVLYRDVLGLYEVDVAERVVRVRFCDTGLEWCEGSRPVPGGVVRLRWWIEDGRLAYRVSAPPGYRIDIENLTRRELRPTP